MKYPVDAKVRYRREYGYEVYEGIGTIVKVDPTDDGADLPYYIKNIDTQKSLWVTEEDITEWITEPANKDQLDRIEAMLEVLLSGTLGISPEQVKNYLPKG